MSSVPSVKRSTEFEEEGTPEDKDILRFSDRRLPLSVIQIGLSNTITHEG